MTIFFFFFVKYTFFCFIYINNYYLYLNNFLWLKAINIDRREKYNKFIVD